MNQSTRSSNNLRDYVMIIIRSIFFESSRNLVKDCKSAEPSDTRTMLSINMSFFCLTYLKEPRPNTFASPEYERTERKDNIGTNLEEFAICCRCHHEMAHRTCERHEETHGLCFECLLCSWNLELHMEIVKEIVTETGQGKWVCKEKSKTQR